LLHVCDRVGGRDIGQRDGTLGRSTFHAPRVGAFAHHREALFRGAENDERFGLPFRSTRFVDEQRPFPDAGRPVSWAGLREMAASGLVTIGSHTHSHLLLDRVTPAAAADDLDRSIDLIGTELGADARHFAYPKALAASGEVASVVGRRFRSAAVAGNRVNPPGSANLQRLGRHPVQRPDRTDMDRFRARIGGGARLEGWVREKALPLRERGSVT
jgi:hypothetical protein